MLLREVKMSAAEKACYDTDSPVNRTAVIRVSVAAAGATLPGIIACHTKTGCKKQTTDMME